MTKNRAKLPRRQRVNPLGNGNPKGLMANSEDPDELPRHAAFHQGLPRLLNRQNQSLEKYIIFWKLFGVSQ